MMFDGIGNAVRLRNGNYFGEPGTYWAWLVDGYYDLHFTDIGVRPDGSDVVYELLPTLKAARAEAKALSEVGA
jgi:hypothetical protein